MQSLRSEIKCSVLQGNLCRLDYINKPRCVACLPRCLGAVGLQGDVESEKVRIETDGAWAFFQVEYSHLELGSEEGEGEAKNEKGGETNGNRDLAGRAGGEGHC